MRSRILAAIIDFALPPRCPGCGVVVREMHRFCLECWRSIHLLGDPCCIRCGIPFAYSHEGPNGEECASCITDPPKFDTLRAAVAYGDIARRVVLKLKYGRRPGVAQTLALYMERHLAGMDADALIVPVPLHRWRIWRRGYNQSALIARALGKHTQRPVALELLRRTKHTPLLRGLGRRERALAVRGAFQVTQPEKVAGRTIVLVDDVFTSGATVSACASALKAAGAMRVNILCWARVVSGEDVDKWSGGPQSDSAGAE